MKNAGIWLDKRNAVIVQLDGEKEKVTMVTSDVEEGKPKGGSGSPVHYSPEDTISEKHLLNKKKQDLKNYFQNLITKVENVDYLLIMGPSESKNGLLKEIKSRQLFAKNQMSIESADSMTLPQIKSRVRNFFTIHQ
jgi:hypothetical protein